MPFEPRCEPVRPTLPVGVDPSGRRGPTKSQAAGRGWRRVGHNAYVPSWVDASTVEQRICEAATHLCPGGAVTGWAALRMMGAAYFEGRLDGVDLPVALVLGHRRGRRTHEGVTLSYEPVDVEIFDILGVPCVHPARALFDEMRRTPEWRDAVVAFDMAAAAGLVSRRRMQVFLEAHRSWRRATRVATALPHGSEHARSPRETRLRLVWTEDAGLPEPHVNRTVRTSSGRLVCVPDQFDEEAGLVVEYEGEEHRKIRRHASDAARHERCREVGLEYCMVTAPDMRRPDVVVRRLQAARARAAFTPVTERRWVVAPRDSVPLDEVLDSREDMARQLWQHRGVRILPW